MVDITGWLYMHVQLQDSTRLGRLVILRHMLGDLRLRIEDPATEEGFLILGEDIGA